jgi:hypothetical protein
MADNTLFEKTLKPAKRSLPLVWMITVPLLVVVGAVFWWYLSTTPPPPKTPGESVYVPPDGLKKAGDKDFDWYQEFVKILDVKGQIVINFAGDRVIVINGLFENRGERAVEAAEVKITFYDPEQKIIRERVIAPLRMETGMKMPLKSLETRNWSVRFENMPINLQVGKLEVVLTGLKLAPRALY